MNNVDRSEAFKAAGRSLVTDGQTPTVEWSHLIDTALIQGAVNILREKADAHAIQAKARYREARLARSTGSREKALIAESHEQFYAGAQSALVNALSVIYLATGVKSDV